MFLLFISVLAAVGIGVLGKFALDWFQAPFRATGKYLLVGALVTGLLVAPGVVFLGGHFAHQSALSYDEFWNGYETQAVAERDTCEYDGSCSHTYDCDPYPVTTTSTDSKGNVTSTTTIHYHSCPYATEEWTFYVETTLDTYVVASNIFTENPVQWRAGGGIPGYVERGVPAAWQAAKDRIDRGDPGPVTAVRTYENYILASQSTILKRYSDSIETYQAEGMLPKPADSTTGTLQASKAYGVGIDLSPEWRERVMRFNAALGTELQGDLHLVVVKGDVDKDAYTGALQAYWQSPELGDKALSKNALVVVLGTENGRTVEWAKSFTGMPKGNEHLLKQISSELPGTALDPEVILGNPRGLLADGDVDAVHHSNGVLESLVWGPNEFARVCMVCEGEDDQGVGFSYLSSDIQPSTGQKVAIFSVALFLSALAWGGLLFLLGEERYGYDLYGRRQRVPTAYQSSPGAYGRTHTTRRSR